MRKRGWNRREAFQLSGTAIAGGVAAGLFSGPAAAAKESGNIYTRVGVKPFINLTATYTINGGALTLPEVKRAMDEASRYSVNLDELMEGVGKRIAELLGSESAIVTSGCAAALAHSTAAALAGADPERMKQLPDLTGLRDQVIMPKASRNPYDHAFRSVGVTIVEINSSAEFDQALTDRVAMVAVLGTGEAKSPVRLEEIVSKAHARNIPVIVDAAAELPFKPNPYLSRGADLVAYSGGKIIRGPQCAGVLLGRRDLVQAAWLNSSPHHAFGRSMKVGKEEIMGMLAALEVFNKANVEADYRKWEGWFNEISNTITPIGGIKTKINPPLGASPFPVMEVAWDPNMLGITAGEIGRKLLEGEPRIMSHAEGDGHQFIIRPVAMQPGQQKLVAARLKEIFDQAPRSASQPPAPPSADISGIWDVKVTFVRGTADHKLDLQAAKGKVKGTHRGTSGSGPLEGRVSGNQVRLTSAIPRHGVKLGYEFTGVVEGGKMSGELDLGEYGKASWSATKAS